MQKYGTETLDLTSAFAKLPQLQEVCFTRGEDHAPPKDDLVKDAWVNVAQLSHTVHSGGARLAWCIQTADPRKAIHLPVESRSRSSITVEYGRSAWCALECLPAVQEAVRYHDPSHRSLSASQD